MFDYVIFHGITFAVKIKNWLSFKEIFRRFIFILFHLIAVDLILGLALSLHNNRVLGSILGWEF